MRRQICEICIEEGNEKSEKCKKRLLEFCSQLSTRVTFATNLVNYNLSMKEYKDVAINDFVHYYTHEDKKRRIDFKMNTDYRKNLLAIYHTVESVDDFLDRYQKYDLIELDEVDNTLKDYVSKANNKQIIKNIISVTNNDEELVRAILNDSLIESKFTHISHCTIGGLWKLYNFRLDENLKKYLLNVGEIYTYYSIGELVFLDDPAFYCKDRLLLSVCTHERTSTLFLTTEEYDAFKLLEIPYRLYTENK